MRQVALAGLLLLASGAAASGQEDCKAIQDPTARVACDDNGATKQPRPAAKQQQPKEPKRKGTAAPTRWEMKRTRDAMNDTTFCVVSPIGRPEIQITHKALTLSYASGRGMRRFRHEVQSFRYRIDEAPESEMQVPTEIERQTGFVRLTGEPFERILAGRRLVVSTLTLDAGIKEEDLSLAGMRQHYDRMLFQCDAK
jgi:hypothetical protein